MKPSRSRVVGMRVHWLIVGSAIGWTWVVVSIGSAQTFTEQGVTVLGGLNVLSGLNVLGCT